ncbi:unnamed protein product [Closterium sp. Naga37s-1]|nr:unnamed protein product [Closterium sp. Naga37s-1]
MAPAARQRRPLAAILQRSRGALLVALAAVVMIGVARFHLPLSPSLLSAPSPPASSLRSPFLQQPLPVPLIHRPLTDYFQPDSPLPPALPPLLNPLAPHVQLQQHAFVHLLAQHSAAFQPGLLHDWLGATAFFEWLCPHLAHPGAQGAGEVQVGSAEGGGGEEEVSDDARVVSGAWEEGGSEGGWEEEIPVVESRQRVCAAHLAREQQADAHPGGVSVDPVGASAHGGAAHGEDGSAGREGGSAGSGAGRAAAGEYAGYLPSADGAYVELLDALEAVLRSHLLPAAAVAHGGSAEKQGGEGRFTVVSAGPLLHAMTAFAAAHAYRQVRPYDAMALVVVHPDMPKQLHALARLNAVPHFTHIPLALGGGEVKEREPGRWATVGDVLAGLPRCDLLDIDADRAEKFAFDDPDAFTHGCSLASALTPPALCPWFHCFNSSSMLGGASHAMRRNCAALGGTTWPILLSSNNPRSSSFCPLARFSIPHAASLPPAVQRVVRRVQITTHGGDVHGKLEALFRLKGWLKALDLPPPAAAACLHPTRAFMRAPPSSSSHDPNESSSSQQPHSRPACAPVPRPECVTHTPWGPMLLREGLLSFLNPSFAHQEDIVRPPLTPLPPALL